MIEVRDLVIRYGDRVVANVPELVIERGTVTGVAGESGSGKSQTAMALLGLTSMVGGRATGSIKLDGVELVGMSQRRLRQVRGRRIALIIQSPRAALNPTLTLGNLFRRTLRLHEVPRAEVRTRILAAMDEVVLDPALLDRYPHQVSGGQAQRFAIAMAAALRADFVVADEPTSALDVTVQAEVVALLRRLRDTHGTGLLFISHDLALLGQLADRLVVMRNAEVVESGLAAQVLTSPSSDYTKELLAAVPVISSPGAAR